jgi:hypothetical protein
LQKDKIILIPPLTRYGQADIVFNETTVMQLLQPGLLSIRVGFARDEAGVIYQSVFRNSFGER